jgi:hypothetical protein
MIKEDIKPPSITPKQIKDIMAIIFGKPKK